MDKIVVIGFGNSLMGDDGVGIWAAQALQTARLPGCVSVLDGGVASFEVLDVARTAKRIIIVDAVTAGGEPGDIYHLPLTQLAAEKVQGSLSLHEFSLLDSYRLAEALGPLPPVELYGIEPGKVEFSMELTEAVESAMHKVVKEIIASVTGDRLCQATNE